uniref:Uncharacterized protein n=1 Tax=Panagrolaimus sp. ES5 TaxID=591445 RepID=A0AC34FQV1_9BILA
MSTLWINLEGIIALLFFHGITFVWILIFQCGKKPAGPDSKKPIRSEMKQPSSYTTNNSTAPPKPGLSEAVGGASQVSGVPPGANSFAQQTGNQSTMPATSNMTQTQQSQVATQQSQAFSSKKPTTEDDGGYDNLNPSSKPIESVKK